MNILTKSSKPRPSRMRDLAGGASNLASKNNFKTLHSVDGCGKDKFFYSTSPLQTKKTGRMLSEYLKPGALVFLSGELGSGKTTFVQGMAGGFGIKGFIRSSSFVIVNEYKGKKAKLYHIDLYRLDKKDLKNIGLDDYLNSDGVCVVEWAQKMQVNRLHNYWDIEITWESEKNRKIKVSYRK